jgi:hypothetical protein
MSEVPVTGRRGARAIAALFVAALLAAAPIWWLFALPVLSGTKLPQHPGHVPILLAHAMGGTFMLGAGALALYVGWTKRWRRWHKGIGHSYLGVGGVGALAGLFLSLNPPHPPFSVGVATGALAVTWLAFAAMALRAAVNRRFDSHREWVIRSYVVTWTFVGCRIAQNVPVFAHLGEEGITAAIWLYWVAPVLICEVALQWRRGAPLSRG